MNKILWEPKQENINSSEMMKFIRYLNEKENITFETYEDLHSWSIKNIAKFWLHLSTFSQIIFNKTHTEVVDDAKKMPGARWFKGSKLNFAENLLRHRDNHNAIITVNEKNIPEYLTYNELFEKVSKVSSYLRKIGIKENDRVVGYMPNVSETVIAMLATSSIGAIWSSCSPDFGVKTVLDRFGQIKPKLLFFTNGYQYNGKIINCVQNAKKIISMLPSLKNSIMINHYHDHNYEHSHNWDDVISLSNFESIHFEQLPFNHPLYIMYSSGTTGKPKSIVHSAGGTLVQHIKELQLHTNVKRDDVIFYFTTCGWMMWNWLVSSLYQGATIVLYEGNPCYPDKDSLLKLADQLNFTIFGTSAKYISILKTNNVKPKLISNFKNLKSILSTGSTLSEENFDYIYDHFSDVQLSSISGGTDIISCFALGNPLLPVYRGELQSKGLAMDIDSYDSSGKSLKNEKGELVCKSAFPSMPIYFWNDDNDTKYLNAYFNTFKNIWSHGDYVEINDHNGITIYGRSDATLNPGGVRIGTAEIYNVLEKRSDIDDSLVIGKKNNDDELILLFVKLKNNEKMQDQLIKSIKSDIRLQCSPRHVPTKIFQIDEIPYTINGKKVEIAVKNIINNLPLKNTDSIANPKSLEYFYNFKNNE